MQRKTISHTTCGKSYKYIISMVYGIITVLLSMTTSYGFQQDTTTAGWLKVSSNVDSLYIVPNHNYDNVIHYTTGDSLSLPVGAYRLTFVHRDYMDVRFLVHIRENATTHRNVNFRSSPYFQQEQSSYKRITEGIPYNISIITDADSEIIINDSLYSTGYFKGDIGPFSHNVEIKSPHGFQLTRNISIQPSGYHEFELFVLPNRSSAQLLGIIPGASQIYKGQNFKGIAIISAFTATAFTFIISNSMYNSLNKEYEKMQTTYLGTRGQDRVYLAGLEVDAQFEKTKRMADFSNNTLGVLLGIYIINVFDAFLSTPASGYRTEFGTAHLQTANGNVTGIQLTFEF